MGKVVMNFDQSGGIEVDAQEFQGTACKEATSIYVNAFSGGKRTEEEKPEYYESEAVSANNMNSQRF